ncbi:MAG: AI-2E family transporter [Caldilineaceae bacterium]|nr:AI-2E family transporter [Caldilineaceae bacterium]
MSFTEFFKRFLTVLLVLLIWAGIWAARSTILMGFAAALIAVGISIPAGWLQRIGWQRKWALAAAVVGMILILLVLILWLVPRLLSEFVALLETIPDAVSALVANYNTLRDRSPFLTAALPAPPTLSTRAIDPVAARTLLNRFVNAGLAIAPTLLGGINDAATVLINLGFVLFIAVFFVIDPLSYVKASLYLIPERYHTRAVDVWNQFYRTAHTWISTLMISISITMLLVWVILGLLLGMPNAIIVAVFAGLATFVPNIGAFLPIIPIAIFSLADDPGRMLILIPAYLLIQLTESNIITPSLIKAELNIPAGGLMLFQLLMTVAFGALGLLLAVPMLGVLIVLVREIYSYDLLGLRHTAVQLYIDARGHLELHKREVEPMTSEPFPPADELPVLAQPESDR